MSDLEELGYRGDIRWGASYGCLVMVAKRTREEPCLVRVSPTEAELKGKVESGVNLT